MARGQKVPDSVVAEIAAKLESGAKRKDIMKEYHLGYEKISSIAIDHGITGKMSEDFRDLFTTEWSNIYPGDDARRKKMEKNKGISNKLPDSIGRIKDTKVFNEEAKSEFSDENDREFYEKFPDRWKNICGKLKRFTKHDQEVIE